MNQSREFATDLKALFHRGMEVLQACRQASVKWAYRHILRFQCKLALMMDPPASTYEFHGASLSFTEEELKNSKIKLSFEFPTLFVLISFPGRTAKIPLSLDNKNHSFFDLRTIIAQTYS